MLVSVIIPMRNEERFVARCLDSVLAQVGLPGDLEILCVDGRSTDRTRAIVEQYAARDPRVRLVDNPARVVPHGLNLALAQARGEVIVRLDCHARYAPDYLRKCLEVLERTGADNVGGYLETLPEQDTPVGRAIAAATSSPFGVGGSRFRIGGQEREVDTVPFGCFRRDVFERFGPFDERLVRNQDIELNTRIRRGGGRIVISPEIRATYYNRATFAGLRQQSYQNGLWNAYTLYLAGACLRPRHLIPAAFVAALVLLPLAGLLWWGAWLLAALTVVAYVGAGAIMAMRTARQAGVLARHVFLAYLNLHVPYGLGFWYGVLSAPLRFGIQRGRPTHTRRAPGPAAE